jgi:hypothetical protein
MKSLGWKVRATRNPGAVVSIKFALSDGAHFVTYFARNKTVSTQGPRAEELSAELEAAIDALPHPMDRFWPTDPVESTKTYEMSIEGPDDDHD